MPFTTEQFLDVFRNYNLSVFPAQIIFNILAVVCILFISFKKSDLSPYISLIMFVFWIWIGIVYHFLFFTPINKAAYLFSAMFVIQGLIFYYQGVLNKKINYEFKPGIRSYTGLILILYSLVLYPIIGIMAGHSYPSNPTFGLPCPTTIFTFGILLMTVKLKLHLILIPIIWSFIGFFAAIKFEIYEDVGLLLSGLITIYFFKMKKVEEKEKEIFV